MAFLAAAALAPLPEGRQRVPEDVALSALAEQPRHVEVVPVQARAGVPAIARDDVHAGVPGTDSVQEEVRSGKRPEEEVGPHDDDLGEVPLAHVRVERPHRARSKVQRPAVDLPGFLEEAVDRGPVRVRRASVGGVHECDVPVVPNDPLQLLLPLLFRSCKHYGVMRHAATAIEGGLDDNGERVARLLVRRHQAKVIDGPHQLQVPKDAGQNQKDVLALG
mmetsp:Transcript_9903/g.26923  ORF Transcript_9903/g.26923 Transcript_9903/m.26923 type:complete len:220 (+) Transcript_9903:270-929(+)